MHQNFPFAALVWVSRMGVVAGLAATQSGCWLDGNCIADCQQDGSSETGDSEESTAADHEATETTGATGASEATSTETTSSEITSSEDTSTEVATTDSTMSGICGDGRVDPGEHCDDGNDDALDGCDTNCQPSPRRRWQRVIERPEVNGQWSLRTGGDMLHLLVQRPDEMSALAFTENGQELWRHHFAVRGLGTTAFDGGRRVFLGRNHQTYVLNDGYDRERKQHVLALNVVDPDGRLLLVDQEVVAARARTVAAGVNDQGQLELARFDLNELGDEDEISLWRATVDTTGTLSNERSRIIRGLEAFELGRHDELTWAQSTPEGLFFISQNQPLVGHIEHNGPLGFVDQSWGDLGLSWAQGTAQSPRVEQGALVALAPPVDENGHGLHALRWQNVRFRDHGQVDVGSYFDADQFAGTLLPPVPLYDGGSAILGITKGDARPQLLRFDETGRLANRYFLAQRDTYPNAIAPLGERGLVLGWSVNDGNNQSEAETIAVIEL